MLTGKLIIADYRFEEEWKDWLYENSIKAVKLDVANYALFFKAKKIKKLLKFAKTHNESIRHISLVE